MDNDIFKKLKGFVSGQAHAPTQDAALNPDPSVVKEKEQLHEVEDIVSHSLTGAVGILRGYHFPHELIGGCCPRIVGEEENIVWNAAAEAVDSERVHLVWQAKGDKIWYLAVRSAEVASDADKWCPFAALLPGQKDAAYDTVCYTFYSDESAVMMTLTRDTLQIHRGTASVLRVKADRIVQELGENIPIVELSPDIVDKLTPTPWYSLSLFEDRTRRILATLSVLFALTLAGVSVLIWLFASMSIIGAHADLSSIRARSEVKSIQLMENVQGLRASPLREHVAKFAEINDGLLALNGFLDFYQIINNKVTWRANVPVNVTSNRITEIGGQTLDAGAKWVIIGNTRDALNFKPGRN